MATATSWYRDGTVAVTAGSKVVSGTGSAWLKQVLAGDLFHLADANGVITTLPAEVAQINSDTELVLKAPWSGATASGHYAVVRNFTGSLPSDMAARLSTCLATQQLAIDQWVKFLTTNGPITITALNGDSIQTTGLLTFGDVASAVDSLQTVVETKAPLASPALTGTPTAPTAASGTATTQIASTAFVQTGLDAKQSTSAKDASGGYAGLTLFKLNIKNALGTITSFFTNANTAARTYTFKDRDGIIADDTDVTTLNTAIAAKAPLASPVLTGTPAAPTAAAGTASTQIATTAFVQQVAGNFVGQIAVNSSRTLLASEVGNIINASGTITATLPVASGVRVGGIFQINNTGGGVITVAASAGDNMYGVGIGTPRTFVLGYGDSITIANVGGVWYAWGGVQLGACAAFTSQQGSNGYYRHPGGAIHQYGTSSAIAAGETRTITFPTAFLTGAKAPVIWGDAGGNFRVVSISNGSMQVINVSSFSSNLYYQVDGY